MATTLSISLTATAERATAADFREGEILLPAEEGSITAATATALTFLQSGALVILRLAYAALLSEETKTALAIAFDEGEGAAKAARSTGEVGEDFSGTRESANARALSKLGSALITKRGRGQENFPAMATAKTVKSRGLWGIITATKTSESRIEGS